MPSPFLRVISVFLTCLSAASLSAELRDWESRDGRSIRAEFVRFQDNGTVILKREDGWEVPVPVDMLSSADQDWLKNQRSVRPTANQTQDIDWNRPRNSPDFNIRSVKKTVTPGYIKTQEGWEQGIDALAVKVRYAGKLQQASGSVSAYFYDRDGRLIEKQAKPARIQNDDGGYTNPPAKFARNEQYDVYFPLSKFLEDSGWRRAVITFGNANQLSARIYRSGSFEHLAFDGKEKLFPGWSPQTGETLAGAAALDFKLEIDRIRRDNHDLSMWADGDWKKNQDCLKTKVRVRGDLPSGECQVSLYLFNREGKQIKAVKVPSMTNIGESDYVKVPRIADKNKWYPVFFALDNRFSNTDWRSAVIVFLHGGKAVASCTSSTGHTLETLTYPDKALVLKTMAETK